MVCGGGSSSGGALSSKQHTCKRNRVLSTPKSPPEAAFPCRPLPADDSITNKMFHFIAAKIIRPSRRPCPGRESAATVPSYNSAIQRDMPGGKVRETHSLARAPIILRNSALRINSAMASATHGCSRWN